MPDPAFIVTVDTEGDNLWAGPREITTRNAAFLPRFQALCERYGLKPVYLTNHEMALSGCFVEFGRDVVARGAGEIGMHLHAWNSPPLRPLSDDDFRHQPYLIEFPAALMKEKIKALTGLLEDRFERPMVSHRAGRWAFDERYAALLLEQGYRVDCSVTPGLDWRANPGAPTGAGGADYRAFPRQPYFLDPRDVSAPADAGPRLLEVPMTVRESGLYRGARWAYETPLVRRAANRLSPGLSWLCPVQCTLRAALARHLQIMLAVARAARRDELPHLQFMVHSSELMPGGSPDFRTAADVDLLYEHLEILFAEASTWCHAATLAEFDAGFRDAARGRTSRRRAAVARRGSGRHGALDRPARAPGTGR